jgi:hypothetical protein
MICIDNKKYIAEFEHLIESNQNKDSNVNKDKLFDILESRLNGSFNVDCFTQNNLSFDFEKNLTDEQKYYLEQFDKYYYKEELINDKKHMLTIIDPIVLKIKNSYDNFIHFTSTKPDTLKQSLLFISSYGTNLFELNKILEFCLILIKLNQIQKLIIDHFHTILEPEFDIKNFVDMNKSITFSDFYNSISDFISEIYCSKMDKINKKHITEAQKKELEIYSNMLIKYKKILNGLFWIVYANEFKFIDNIQKKYLINDEMLEEYQKKMSVWFKIEDEVITESGEIHKKEIDVVEDFLEKFEETEFEIYEMLEKKAQEIKLEDVDNLTMERILDEELDKLIDGLTKDTEEKNFYKTQFSVSAVFVEMNVLFNKLHTKLVEC